MTYIMQKTTKTIFLYEDKYTLKSIRHHYSDHATILEELCPHILFKIEYGKKLNQKKYDAIYIPPSSSQWPLDDHFLLQLSKALLSNSKLKLMASCGGVVRLAKTGIINKKKVTSHWRFLDELKSLNNNLTLELENKLVIDKNLITSGGVMSYLSLFNFIITHLFTSKVTKKYKRFVVSPSDSLIQPNIEKYNYQYPAVYNDVFKLFSKMQRLTLKDLSKELGKSPRQTQRDLIKNCNAPFSKILTDYRLSKSTKMLQDGESVKQCSYNIGFEDPMSFRRFFKKNMKMNISTFLSIYL